LHLRLLPQPLGLQSELQHAALGALQRPQHSPPQLAQQFLHAGRLFLALGTESLDPSLLLLIVLAEQLQL
jgi:hypothetical protein